MALLVWVMTGLALWHFTVFLPDRFWGGIVGAFLGALVGAFVFGLIINAGSIPGQNDTTLLTALEAIPGAVLGMAVVWFAGVRAASSRRTASRDARRASSRRSRRRSTTTGWSRPRRVRRARRAGSPRRGLDGVFVAGTTGEGVLLEDDEVAALVERALGARRRVIAQVGRPSTPRHGAARRAARSSSAPTRVAAYVPWFYPAKDAEARDHFQGLLEAAGDTPAFLYNIPRRTVNDLTPELAGELAAAGFAGMKDSTGDFERHEAYLDVLDGPTSSSTTGSEPLVAARLPARRRGRDHRAGGRPPGAVRRAARGARGRRRRAPPSSAQAADRRGQGARSSPRARRSPASSAASPPPRRARASSTRPRRARRSPSGERSASGAASVRS